MPTTFPTPCTNCLDSYICPDGIVDVRCIKYGSGTLSDYLLSIENKVNGISWTEHTFVCEEASTFTHDFDLTDFENIIVQVVNEVTGQIHTGVFLTNYTANSVDVTLDSNCSDPYTIVIK